ncbi:hypothetical protein TVAG_068940 [Trichomonas vaginalis G3]|uniref:Uncharacterized protein n=1 Tax=Trichomonas vaginalis (strain ATCC PRA-98 / G3) TaxID=412133 RepID=A2EZL9_TRIV3|nr:hypothetical protein TVAGG3_0923540 [Trichomonas vaginalis G3]EAY01927.1 hypothetical protein TVAG_068940 [Trichomonas vaginalis G3]KAI5485297.1 hypothetical protein TVAGG3_0923540 [Trichomonas vaginalis G3]|eukprot:XP_001330445.1 hypothetical protein [Trichomonas vaginalis G3]
MSSLASLKSSEDEDSPPYMLLPDVSSDEMHLIVEGSEVDKDQIKQVSEEKADTSADLNTTHSSKCCLLI